MAKESYLSFAIIGGEKLENVHVENIIKLDPGIEIYNEYGPTETTIGSWYLTSDVDKPDETIIGRPISNTQVYILDPSKLPVPIGVIGELCIGGDGLARGYLNDEELTDKKFVANPFVKGQRIYLSGDLARWLPDGNIEFMGRKDDQVKIRGHRIEPAEIEYVLREHELIESAVVLARETGSQEKELVAYIVSNKAQNTSDLRAYLSKQLPGYMIPSYFVELEELPLTPNGKVDKKSLPSPEGIGLGSGVDYVAPRNDTEAKLVKIWEEVLRREGIGVYDSFYDLGGDSIKSIQIVSRLRQQGYSLKVEDVLLTPVLSDLVSKLGKIERVIDQSEVSGEVELTPIQRWFFVNSLIPVKSHYNQSFLLEYIEDRIDKDLLDLSLSKLVSHHDALRMTYGEAEGVWYQENRVMTSNGYSLDVYDLSNQDGLSVMGELCDKLQSGIDITTGPLLKVGLFRLSDKDCILLVIHHLVVDGVSCVFYWKIWHFYIVS